jgi:hypothetical protein
MPGIFQLPGRNIFHNIPREFSRSLVVIKARVFAKCFFNFLKPALPVRVKNISL